MSKLAQIFYSCTLIQMLYYICVCNSESDELYACKVLDYSQDMNVSIAISESNVTVSFAGPADKWYSFGLGNTVMQGTNVIVVNGDGSIQENVLSRRGQGIQISTSFTVVSTQVIHNSRMTVITRMIDDISNQHYSYPQATGSEDLIWAYGSVQQFNSASKMVGYGHSTLEFTADADADCHSNISIATSCCKPSIPLLFITVIFYMIFN